MNKLNSSNKNYWEHFPHMADVGVRGVGETLEKTFEMAALALTAVVTEPESVRVDTVLNIECKETDIEMLFLDWLNAVIYEMDLRRMVFSQFNVHISDNELKAELKGEALDVKRHLPRVEIKGATMTELRVAQLNSHWQAQCVVDV